MIRELIKVFDKFDGSRSKHTLFQDWCKLTALSISNQCWYSEQRERDYLQLAGQYKKGELQLLCEMTGMLWLAFDAEIDDYLGKIYMEGTWGISRQVNFLHHLIFLN